MKRSEKLILQLISTRIPSDYVDIALNRKCNTIDLPALQSVVKTCEKSLLNISPFRVLITHIVIVFLHYWIARSLGVLMLSRHMLMQRSPPFRAPLVTLLTSVFFQTMPMRRFLNFLNHLSLVTLIGEKNANELVNYQCICLMI